MAICRYSFCESKAKTHMSECLNVAHITTKARQFDENPQTAYTLLHKSNRKDHEPE